MSDCLDAPRRSLTELRGELVERMKWARALEARACILISAFDALAVLDREITLRESRIDYAELSREHIARYPKIRARLQQR